jgi:hypothetical protein
MRTTPTPRATGVSPGSSRRLGDTHDTYDTHTNHHLQKQYTLPANSATLTDIFDDADTTLGINVTTLYLLLIDLLTHQPVSKLPVGCHRCSLLIGSLPLTNDQPPDAIRASMGQVETSQ